MSDAMAGGGGEVAVWEGDTKPRQQQEECYAAAARLLLLNQLLRATFQSCASLAFNHNWQVF